jgi:hypothetical protein
MTGAVLFEEKQYLGYNKYSMIRRTVFAIFCFVLYYWSENPKPVSVGAIDIGPYPVGNIGGSGQLFFLLGLGILLLSIILLFVLHIHTRVYADCILLKGPWRAKAVEIPFSELVSARKIRLKETLLNHPAYHHFMKGKLRFYSRGSEAVDLKSKEGLVYRIGSQRADELLKTVRDCLVKSAEK